MAKQTLFLNFVSHLVITSYYHVRSWLLVVC